jgi:hypothetical protein
MGFSQCLIAHIKSFLRLNNPFKFSIKIKKKTVQDNNFQFLDEFLLEYKWSELHAIKQKEKFLCAVFFFNNDTEQYEISAASA